MTTALDEGVERDGAWRARAIAATLGAFDPTRLLDPTKESDLASLGKLAAECEEVLAGGVTRWFLKPDVRTRVLDELERDELLGLIKSFPPSAGDEFGRLLQAILRNGAPVAPPPSTDLGLLRTALRFAAPFVEGASTRNAAQKVDLQLSRQDADKAVQVLLPRQLVGRDKELGKLRRFVTAKPNLSTEDILWVTGVGGSGKSALLAEFARTLRKDNWSGTPVLQVDFDRPALFRGTLTTLMMEVSRQLELYFPKMERALSTYRRAARLGGPVELHRSRDSFEQLQYTEAQSSSAWQQAMQGHLPIESKVVLILDTAEEVGLSSAFDLMGLRRWLRQLRRSEGLPNLRVVLSGRAFSADQLALVPPRQRLEVDDLEPDDAVELLKLHLSHKGVARDLPLGKLVDMVGGNPLSLKILATYLAEGGKNAADRLLADRSGFDKRFAQSFLYKRILGRLRTEDQDLVKIAHPGLVLRRVTPDLIRSVLAEPCNLQSVDEERSRKLLQHLSGQVWLVQSTANPDVVVHRRDLRRLMLQAMTAQDTERALAIHRAAAQYYTEERDPFMTPEEQAIEGLYHAMFAPNAELPEGGMLEAVARTLGEDLDTLPLTVRAQFKLTVGRQLTDIEQEQIGKEGRKLYRSMVELKALKLTGERRAGAHASPRLVTGGDSRLVGASLHEGFESGNLTAVARSASSAVLDFAKSVMLRGRPDVGDTDLTESGVWRAAIASMGRADFVKALMEALPEVVHGPAWERSLARGSRVELSGSEAFHMLFRLHGADCPAPLVSARGRSLRISGVQGLRRFQLLDAAPFGEIGVPVRLLADLSTEYVSYFSRRDGSDSVELDGAARADLELQQRMREKPHRPTLNDLGQVGKRDGRLWLQSVEHVPPEARGLLIGRLPEVHVLVRVAARACHQKDLADFVLEATPGKLWPVELSPVTLLEGLTSERERWTATLISVTDRFGLLRRLVDWLEDRGRLKGRPLQLIRTVRAYDLRLRQFV